MYSVIRQYRAQPTAINEVVDRAREGFVPLIKASPGFVSYVLVDAGKGRALTVSTFADKAGAEGSVRLAAGWVKEHLAMLLPTPPEVLGGETRVREVNPRARPTYGVLRRYTADPANVLEIVHRAKEGFVPLISAATGFGRYSIIDAGNGDLVSLTAYESEAAATESTRLAAGWVKEHLSRLLPAPPEVTAGTIRVML